MALTVSGGRSNEAAAGLGLLVTLAGFLVGGSALLDLGHHLVQVQRAQQAADVVVSALAVAQWSQAGVDEHRHGEQLAADVGVRLEWVGCSRQMAAANEHGVEPALNARTPLVAECEVVVRLETEPLVGWSRTVRVVHARAAARMVAGWSMTSGAAAGIEAWSDRDVDVGRLAASGSS